MENIIEVSKQTFELIFKDSHITRVSKKETNEKTFYFNKETDQRGMKVYNYVSSVDGNFFLLDINA